MVLEPWTLFNPVTAGIRKGSNPGYEAFYTVEYDAAYYGFVVQSVAFQYAATLSSTPVTDWRTYCQIVGWESDHDFSEPLSMEIISNPTQQVLAQGDLQSLDIAVHCRQ